MDFVIDPEISVLLNPLTNEERSDLESSIVLDGCRDAGIVAVLPDGSKFLADGHNRKTICAYFDIPFLFTEKAFLTRESVIQWVIKNQLGRRNLTDERKAYYCGMQFLNTRKSVGNPLFPQNEGIGIDHGEAAEKVAAEHGVSRSTVERNADFAKAVDALPTEEKEIVLSGKSGMTKADVVNGKKLILCDRCQRTGPVAKCANCIEARKAARKPKKEPEQLEDSEPETPTVPVDGNGVPWSGNALIAIKAEPQFIEMARQLSKMASLIVKDESLHLYSFSMQSIVAAIKGIRSTLLDALPAYVCPYCAGTLKTIEGQESGKACNVCNRQGWVAKSVYGRSPKGFGGK